MLLLLYNYCRMDSVGLWEPLGTLAEMMLYEGCLSSMQQDKKHRYLARTTAREDI
jgi:hypothetical protein